jgi:hypothetical protein
MRFQPQSKKYAAGPETSWDTVMGFQIVIKADGTRFSGDIIS